MSDAPLRSLVTAVAVSLPLTLGGQALAADTGMEILEQYCTTCHDIEGPAPTTLEELRNRKGPDLFYAGNKYKRDWLESWLQAPERIRPAGVYYGNHVKTVDGADTIDEDTLVEHLELRPADAAAVADTLMTFTAKSDLIEEGAYKEGKIALSMGEMMFDRFRGCLACHEIEPGYGGLSGPEVYTAANRLQEDYLISFMRDPQAWDPRIFMPDTNISEADLQKFVHYMRALAEENE